MMCAVGPVYSTMWVHFPRPLPGLSAFSCQPDFGTSWTLTVFPASAENAPAMGPAGLGVIAVLIAAGGATILASRKKSTPE